MSLSLYQTSKLLTTIIALVGLCNSSVWERSGFDRGVVGGVEFSSWGLQFFDGFVCVLVQPIDSSLYCMVLVLVSDRLDI